MTEVLAKRVMIETGSADDVGALLFIDEKLVACLVQLSNEVHGDLRDQWCVEAIFGDDVKGLPHLFPELADAVAAITLRLTGTPLALTQPVSDLSL